MRRGTLWGFLNGGGVDGLRNGMFPVPFVPDDTAPIRAPAVGPGGRRGCHSDAAADESLMDSARLFCLRAGAAIGASGPGRRHHSAR